LSDWTTHGGNLARAQAAYPQAPQPWLDLSTGINPTPWPGAPQVAIDWQRLPEDEALAALELAASGHFGVSADRVCALPGSEFALRGLRHLGLPGPFCHAAPGYGTHLVAFPDSQPAGYDQLAASASRGGTTLVANPSNPEGRLVAPQAVLALANAAQQSGGWLIVDEAFADAHAGASVLPLLQGGEPVIVLRSFGKFFGLAGIRLGFAVAPPGITARWRALVGSWPVSAAAIAIGTAAYADRDWIVQTRAELAARATACDAMLRGHGLSPMGESPLFRLIDCAAASLFDHLARHAILTRPFDYAPRWLRLGVPACAAELARLDAALDDV
jgi:cobalamin biosynthetic protein CobC